MRLHYELKIWWITTTTKKKTGSNFVFDIKEQQPTNAFQEEIGNESTCLPV